MDQGNSKHGPAHDESLKHATQGLIRAGRSTHAEEWRDPEPAGEDQPSVNPHTLGGGVPPGMTPQDVADRSALASYLGPAIYPAGREQLLATLNQTNAPERLSSAVASLPPDREFRNVQEIAVALGLAVEKERF
jgi:hypothetical protein